MMSLLNVAAASWWEWMTAMSLQVAVFVILVVVLDRLLARWAWPQLHLALWLAVIIKLILPPTVTSSWSIVRLWSGGFVVPEAAEAAFLDSNLAFVAFLVWAVGLLLLGALATRRYR